MAIKKRSKITIKYFRKWHRKLGIFAAFFLVFLSITGIALNHTDSLALAHYPIKNNGLLDHYNILKPNDIRIYTKDKLIVTNNIVWMNNELLMDSIENIVAITYVKSIIVVISNGQINLFTSDGELIDRLDQFTGVPTNIQAVQVIQDTILIKTPKGVFQTDSDFLSWSRVVSYDDSKWIHSLIISPVEREEAVLLYRSKFLTLERMIVDMHSGRIFGLFGVLFMDVVAILLILLSISGLYIWLKHTNLKNKSL